MHKTICATFCGKPVESVESVENVIRGSPAVGQKVTSCSSHGAPRLAHDIQDKILLNSFKFIDYTASARARAKKVANRTDVSSVILYGIDKTEEFI